MKGFAPALAASLVTIAVGTALALQPGQVAPKKLYSNGDSITRAFDADFPADNLNASWVNGYYGFWEQLFGLPNVKSHNQRITANFGSSGRKNYIAAVNGARVDDLSSRRPARPGKGVNYATVMLGGNDVCRDTIADLPTDAEFEANFRAGIDTLLAQHGQRHHRAGGRDPGREAAVRHRQGQGGARHRRLRGAVGADRARLSLRLDALAVQFGGRPALRALAQHRLQHHHGGGDRAEAGAAPGQVHLVHQRRASPTPSRRTRSPTSTASTPPGGASARCRTARGTAVRSPRIRAEADRRFDTAIRSSE